MASCADFLLPLHLSKMKKMLFGIGVVGLAAAVAGAEFKPAFREGEDFTFKIRYGKITGGYATLGISSIVQIGDQKAYHILSEARSTKFVDTFYKVRDRNEAWMDVERPRSFGYIKDIQEGKYSVDEKVELNYVNHTFKRTKIRRDKNNSVKEVSGEVSADVLDVLSSLYYIRTLPLEVGKSFTLDVHSGEKTFPLLVKVKKLEKVKVKAGKFLCYRVEPVLREHGIFITKGKKMEVWLTADERRMPVLMRSEIFIGHVSAELVKHKIPESPAVPQDVASAPSDEASSDL